MANQALMANAIRALAMDAVQHANSGHPGAPMGMADMAVALWGDHLQPQPDQPALVRPRPLRAVQRPRLDADLRGAAPDRLRPADRASSSTSASCTARPPGHPEVGVTPGVETTTGPLGQGLTNAVGFALAEKLLAAEFNRNGHAIVDHHTYVFLGDGCLMEGISHEACALAGAWKLGKLIALYDDNGISIDGQVTPWFIDNTAERFAAYGWNVIGPIDGHDAEGVSKAIARQGSRTTTAHADHLQDADRQGQPEPRQHRQGPRRAAGRRRDRADAQRAATGRTRPSNCRPRSTRNGTRRGPAPRWKP